MIKIDAMELSDIDSSAWTAAKENFTLSSRKRHLDVEHEETTKRKVKDR